MSLGFATVYWSTGVFFIAMAAVYVLVPYVALACLGSGLPHGIAFGAAALSGTALALAAELFNHRRLYKKQSGSAANMISSLGIYLIVSQCVAMAWGTETKLLRTGLDTTFHLADSVLTGSQVAAFVGSLVLIAAYLSILYLSKIGLRLRAMADNPVELALSGTNVELLRAISFSICGFMTSCASLFAAWDVGFEPHGALAAILPAVVATIIGGYGSFAGVVFGGILLSLFRAEIAYVVSARWQDAGTFVTLSIFLFMRPQGLFGKKLRLEAE